MRNPIEMPIELKRHTINVKQIKQSITTSIMFFVDFKCSAEVIRKFFFPF